VTEDEWLLCEEPGRMLLCGFEFSDRRMRLFAVAVCRLFPDLVNTKLLRKALMAAERLADGLAIEPISFDTRAIRLESLHPEPGRLRNGVASAASVSCWAEVVQLMAWAGVQSESVRIELWRALSIPGSTRLISAAQLLRCIVGNPFRPVAVETCWLTSTVVGLAETIYTERAFDRLPILADALEDAGCGEPALLAHCRGDGPHARGCWAVDLVLGKQ
jgi:hypothetical protein